MPQGSPVVGGRGNEMVQRISRGEAEAVFHAGVTGGFRGHGAPRDPDRQVAILPLDPDGLRYCVEDFHVLVMTLIIDEANDGVTSPRKLLSLYKGGWWRQESLRQAAILSL